MDDGESSTTAAAVPAVPAVPAPVEFKLRACEAWPAQTKVITTYGKGVVTGFREEDNMYSIQLAFGVAYVSPNSVYGSEQLSANALYVSIMTYVVLMLFGLLFFFFCW
jgi:hypothetical protein